MSRLRYFRSFAAVLPKLYRKNNRLPKKLQCNLQEACENLRLKFGKIAAIQEHFLTVQDNDSVVPVLKNWMQLHYKVTYNSIQYCTVVYYY